MKVNWLDLFISLIENFRIILLLLLVIISLFLIHPFIKKPDFVRVEYLDYKIYYGENLFLKGIYYNDTYYKINSRLDLTKFCNKNGIFRLELGKEIFPYIYKWFLTKPFYTENLCKHLEVSDILYSYLRFGSEIEGGVRAILETKNIDKTLEILKTRLDAFGVKQYRIYKVGKYIYIEIPGGGINSIKELLERKGIFYAKVCNKTVFNYRDVVFVCRQDIQCDRIYQIGNLWEGSFEIEISLDAAKRFRKILDECKNNKTLYLDIYLDNEKITSLVISESIINEKDYRKLTKAVISIRKPNKKVVELEKKILQTILSTKPIEDKIKIIDIEIIPPKLGFKFFFNMVFIFLLSLLIILILLGLFYKKINLVIAMFSISMSEIIITLGIYALGNWTIDVASLVAIIASVGMGVDDQITIIEETKKKILDLGIKHALFIILITYILNIAIFLPMALSAEIFLKSYAFTSIILLTIGYLITRPAFADLIKRIK